MKKVLLAITITSLMALPAAANQEEDNAERNEFIGVTSGMTVGALIGGPIGAVLGATFGALISEDVNNKNTLTRTQDELKQREEQLVALNNELQRQQQEAATQLVRMETQIEHVMEEGEASLQFKTASYVLEEHYKPQLTMLAEGLKNNSRMIVHLSGFADRRGDEAYNQALSEQRVITVKQFLIDAGVDEAQLKTESFGESSPVASEQSYENDFFDRRVVLRVDEGQRAMTASN